MTFKKRHYPLIISVLLIMLMAPAVLLFSASDSHAFAPELTAQGQINSTIGAFMRSKASTKSVPVTVLKNNAQVTIWQEVFVTDTKTSATKKWYLVSRGEHVGYVRSDLVKNIVYPVAVGKTKAKTDYRKGAGSSMKKKGSFKKGKIFYIVLEAKANKSNARWYKVVSGSKFYYIKASKVKQMQVLSTPEPPKEDQEVVQSAASARVAAGAVEWAVKIANDNTFHYGNSKHCLHNGCYFCNTQPKDKQLYVTQWETTYCCNPFITAAYAHGGNEQFMLNLCKNGKSYMAPEFTKSDLFANLGHPDQDTLRKGDILCTDAHVAMYVGNGQLVEAASRDDGVPGSASWNNSIRVTSLTASRYNGFKYVFRYVGS